MVATWKKNKLTPIHRLNQIYQQYGVHLDVLKTQTYKGTDGMAKIQLIMRKLRNSPPTSVAGQAVVKITDYQENKIIFGNETRRGPGLPQSNVITLELTDNSRITTRPSGTEPKIKYYVNLQGKDSEILNRRLVNIQNDFIKD